MVTPRVSEVFNITEVDVGRPITDFTHQLIYESLADDARHVMRDLSPFEHEVPTRGDRWLLVRFRPYRTVDDRIDGVVVTFVDITERREANQRLKEDEERQAFLLKLSDAMRAEPDPEAPGTLATRMICERLGAGRCWITRSFHEEGVSRLGPEYMAAGLDPISGELQPADYPETLCQAGTGLLVFNDVAKAPDLTDQERERNAHRG